MTRRTFNQTACLLAPWFLAGAQQQRPNIVLIIADDLTWHDSEPYGGRPRTPHLARLATEGVCFDRMFTATAMCAPTRQAIYTGMYPVRNGAYPNHSFIYDKIRTLPVYLEELGYRVGLAGKEHFGPAPAFPFERLGAKDPDPTDLGSIANFIRRDPPQPFALIFASHQPHVPWDRGDSSAYALKDIAVPPYLVDCPETRQALTYYYAEVTYFDSQVGALLRLLEDPAVRNNTLVMFASEQGTQVPFAKWTCYDAGLKAAFIVRWPGHVKPGTRTAAMAEYVDILPTVLEAAGADPGKSKAPFDGRSFLHVLKDGSRPHKNHVFGVQTTRGIIQGSECYPVRSIRTAKYKYIRNLNSKDEFKNVITGQKNGLIESWIARGGSAEQRARAYLRRPPEELYDIGADPYELRNLAGDPAHARTLRSLSSQLTSWMKSQGDEGIATEMQAKSRQAAGQE